MFKICYRLQKLSEIYADPNITMDSLGTRYYRYYIDGDISFIKNDRIFFE